MAITSDIILMKKNAYQHLTNAFVRLAALIRIRSMLFRRFNVSGSIGTRVGEQSELVDIKCCKTT